jgi:D-alanine-D-alanine ligase
VSDLDRVLVLAGGLSPEREVSLRSGHQVAQALVAVGVDAVVRDVGADLLSWLDTDRPDVVFPVLHGSSGEDGTVQEVLRMVGLPYVGAEPEAARVTYDKPVAKALLHRAGLTIPPSVTLPRQAFHDLGAADLAHRLVSRLGLPLCVKPRSGGSAFGVTRVRAAADLPAALMTCFGYHDEALVERWVDGMEVAVGVVELAGAPVVLPAVEIVPDGGFYDYAARYTAGATEFFCPARLSGPLAEQVAAAALTAHRALGLRDLSRTDFMIDAEGRPHVLETNVAPGMTETSTFPIALRAAGHDFGLTCRDLSAHAATRGGR